MAKVNKSGQHKPTAKDIKPARVQNDGTQSSVKKPAAKSGTPAAPLNAAGKNKQGNKARKPAIGGTAVTGARSTIPKEIPTSGPAQDRPERYNRETRRRMEQMGTGPYNDTTASDPRRKRVEKRIEERKKRQEEVKKTVVTKGPSTNVKIGNKNTYFLLAVLGIVLLIIVIAIIVRHPF
jgi:hypothetical protein